MHKEISNISLIIHRQKSGEETLLAKYCEATEHSLSFDFQDEAEDVIAKLIITEESEVYTCHLNVEIKNEAFRENNNLSMLEPVKIKIETREKPEALTAMYLHRDWWTRPAFITNFAELPEHTQMLYIKEKEKIGCLIPLAGKVFKSFLSPGTKDSLCLTVTAFKGGFERLDEDIFKFARGSDIYAPIHAIFASISVERSLPVKENRTYPEMFEYLGWCSWDAFYTDINEGKVREKADEIKEKQIPIRWVLMDDGWHSVHDQRLYSFAPEKAKFPNGFASMIEDIKKASDIRWFGVWHAFGGYWGGIEPESELAEEEKEHLYHTSNGKLLPYPEAERGYGFFRDWYEQLRREGIDFVKVDGQSAIKNYYENDISVCEAACGSHQALEGAADVYMEGRLINCMGMAMENILGRPGSGLARNSDDFVPNAEEGFEEHILQNAYNALYHDEMYYCDWDMFWSSHKDAVKHAILRAVSGGPIYVSDRIGDSQKEIIDPLILKDGRILRMDRTAKPTVECIFTNPMEKGVIKLANVARTGDGSKAGAIAVYNISGKLETYTISGEDVYDLEGEDFYLYDVLHQKGERLTQNEAFTAKLSVDGYALFLLIPFNPGITIVGLLDKYISFMGVKSIFSTKEESVVILKQAGVFGFNSEEKITSLKVFGKERINEVKENDQLYTIDLTAEDADEILIQIRK